MTERDNSNHEEIVETKRQRLIVVLGIRVAIRRVRERETLFSSYNDIAFHRPTHAGGRGVAEEALSTEIPTRVLATANRPSVAPNRRDLRGAGRKSRGRRPPGTSARPVIFLFEYTAAASPASIGESVDARELAVGFRFLRLREAASGREICAIDFADIDSTRNRLLFGFHKAESWGMWSAGTKSAIVVWREAEVLGEVCLSLDAFPYSGAFPEMKCTFSSSAGHRQELVLRDGVCHFEVAVAVESKAKAVAFFGAPFLAACRNNVSRSNDVPLVSIIILNFNKPEMTLLSAMSVLASSISVTFEIILVDNGSTTERFEMLRARDLPVRLLRNAVNRYFGEGNNLGADVARGEYLLFLNNDAFLAPHCVDALLQAFHAVPDCGAAGPVFRYPDGTLQEAGAFVAVDGGSLQRGRKRRDFDLASLPDFQAVDYVSAACLMIRASRFVDLGGFSYRYDPAYFEDVDLCFRLKLRGERAVLAKGAACVHIENATTRDEMLDDLNAAFGINQAAFFSNWGAFLHERTRESLPCDVIPRRRLRGAAQLDGITQATFMPFPLVPSGAVRQALATTIALGELGPAVLTTADPYSSMRLESVTFDLGLPLGRIKSMPLQLVAQKKLERVYVMGHGICPAYAPTAKRRFFHCQSPFPSPESDGADGQRALDLLPLFEKVFVCSEFAKRAYEIESQRLGVAIRVDIMHPAVATERLLQQKRNDKPWILSVGRFSESGSARRQDVLIDAMKRTSASFRENWTLILCGSVPNNAQDRAHFLRMQESVGTDIRVRFVLSPPRAMLDSLLSQSSVYADACGFRVRESLEFWKCDGFCVSLVEALVAGCKTICYEVGGGPEITQRVESGATFGSVEELAARLEESEVAGLALAIRQKASAQFSEQQFHERILAAVS